jgi:hypothetical protein
MAEVSKSASGTRHGNLIMPRIIKIMFQVFPGVKGTNAQRGIAGVPYTAKTGNGSVMSGTTAADGGVSLLVLTDDDITLTIFDTDYLISVKGSIEASNITKGVQRRLSLLGYELGDIDGSVGKWTDRSLLNLQADSNLNADGNINNRTQTQLVTDFGE